MSIDSISPETIHSPELSSDALFEQLIQELIDNNSHTQTAQELEAAHLITKEFLDNPDSDSSMGYHHIFMQLLESTKDDPPEVATLNEQLSILTNEVKKNKDIAKTFERLAVIDPLTGVTNKRFYEEMLKKSISGYNKRKIPFSLIVVDMDGLKKINDTHGHDIGNKAIQHFAKALAEKARESDIISRYGGDEFTIILTNSNPNNSSDIAKRFQQSLDNASLEIKPGKEISVSGTVGIAHYEKGLDIFKKADENLYQNKENRKTNREK